VLLQAPGHHRRSYEPAFDLGLDSLLVIDLRVSLERRNLAIVFESTLFFDDPRVADLRELLAHAHSGARYRSQQLFQHEGRGFRKPASPKAEPRRLATGG